MSRALLLVTASLAFLVGCACGAPPTPAARDAGLVFSPPPSWWDVSDDGAAVLSATTTAGVFQLRSTSAAGTEVLAEKTTAYGAIGVEYVRAHRAFVVSGLNPNRVPALYTAFVPGTAPLEFFQCASTAPASGFSAGAADPAGFRVALDNDCQSVCQGRRVSFQLSVAGSSVTAGSAVCNGAMSPSEARRVQLHPTARLLAEFEPGVTRLVRFDPNGADETSAGTVPKTARFTGFLSDAPVLLAEEVADGGAALVEYSLGDAGVAMEASAFAGAGGRIQSLGGTQDRALVLAQGPVKLATREQVWRATVRSGGSIGVFQAVTPLGAQVRAVPLADGGVGAFAGFAEQSAGAYGLRIETLSFTPAK